MRLAILLFIGVSVRASDAPKISDGDKLMVRELQLSIARAGVVKFQLQQQWEQIDRAQKEAQEKLDKQVASLTDKYCKGGTLQDDLTCKMPPKVEEVKPEAKPAASPYGEIKSAPAKEPLSDR